MRAILRVGMAGIGTACAIGLICLAVLADRQTVGADRVYPYPYPPYPGIRPVYLPLVDQDLGEATSAPTSTPTPTPSLTPTPTPTATFTPTPEPYP